MIDSNIVGQTGCLRRIDNPPASRCICAPTGRLTSGRGISSWSTRVAIAIVFIATVGAQPSSDLPPEVLLLAHIRQRAASDFAHTPNFTCRESIQRFRGRPGKPLKRVDTVQVEVANIDGRELFAWPGERHFEERTIMDMVGSGLVSDGEYIVDAHNVLLGGAARITYHGAERVAGRDTVRFDFNFATAFSPYTLVVGEAKAVIGEKGAFWADPLTYSLLRLSFVGTDIPDSIGVRATNVQIDYGRTRIGDVDALLPVRAISGLTEAHGDAVSNDIEFTGCRQYTAESVVTAEPPDIVNTPPPAPSSDDVVLPLGYDIQIRLTNAIRLAAANVGDPVEAELASDVKFREKTYAPKGALVTGRIRFLQQNGGRYSVGLEFNEVAFGQTHMRFAARLLNAGPHYVLQHLRSEMSPQLEGVDTIVIPRDMDTLPRGMRMQWKIIGAGE